MMGLLNVAVQSLPSHKMFSYTLFPYFLISSTLEPKTTGSTETMLYIDLKPVDVVS
jgi:hypothetical protein